MYPQYVYCGVTVVSAAVKNKIAEVMQLSFAVIDGEGT